MEEKQVEKMRAAAREALQTEFEGLRPDELIGENPLPTVQNDAIESEVLEAIEIVPAP